MERRLEQDYVDKGLVRFAYRHFIVVRGQESMWAAQASECANEQGKFWEYHDKLFANQAGEEKGAFAKSNLRRFAQELGLKTDQFNSCLDSGKYDAKIRQESQQAQQLGAPGTPSIVVNGRLIPNGTDYTTLQRVIEANLKAK